MAATSIFMKKVVSKAYQTYRNTPVALALFDTIKELLRNGVLTPEQAKILVFQFDYSFCKELQLAIVKWSICIDNILSTEYFPVRYTDLT